MAVSITNYIVDVDWANTRAYGDRSRASWTDETGNCRGFRITRGRTSEFAATQMGSAVLVMNNSDGRFTPEYSSSPLYGNLVPFKKIWLGWRYGGLNWPMFYGYITSIRPDAKSQTCTIECRDITILMSNYHLNLALTQGNTTGNRITAVLDDMGFPVAYQDVDTGYTVLDTYYARNTDALTAINELVDHELGGLFYIDRQGKAVFYNRYARSTYGAALGTIAANDIYELAYDRREDTMLNNVILEAGSFEEGIAGSQVYSYSPLPLRMVPDEIVTFSPNYNTPAKTVITPVEGTDYIANDSPDGTGTARSSSIGSAFTDYGGGASWVLTNNHTGPVWLTMAQIRGTPLGRSASLRVVTEASPSTVIPYDSTYRKDYPWISNKNDLQAFAEYLADNFNTVQPVINVKVYPVKSATIMVIAVQADIGTKVTVTDNTFAYSSQVNEAYFIDSIRIEVDVKSTPKIDYGMSKSFNASGAVWVLDTSALDTETILGW